MQADARERPGQHRGQVRRQVVLPAVQQVLQVQAGLGLAFDGEAALEEERVGILATAREIHEIAQGAADRHVRRARRGPQPAGHDLEGERERHIVDVQAEALAGEIGELAGEHLPAQQLAHGARDERRLQRRRREAQQMGNDGHRIGHGSLRGRIETPSCHGPLPSPLRFVKTGAARRVPR